MQFFREHIDYWDESRKFRNRLQVNTFFFREHHDFGTKVRKSKSDFK